MRRPEVTLMFAQSLDGRIALSNTRTPLSSAVGLELAHRARAEHDAVLVGSSTVRIDDPQLTVRYATGPNPKRVVLSSRLDLPTTARVFIKSPGLLVIGAEGIADATQANRLRDAGAEVRIVAPSADGTVSLVAALRAIADWGVHRLLVEGGARVLSSFLQERRADRVVVEIVPKFLGESGIPCAAALAVHRFDECPSLTDVSVERADSSIVVRGRMAAREKLRRAPAARRVAHQPRV